MTKLGIQLLLLSQIWHLVVLITRNHQFPNPPPNYHKRKKNNNSSANFPDKSDITKQSPPDKINSQRSPPNNLMSQYSSLFFANPKKLYNIITNDNNNINENLPFDPFFKFFHNIWNFHDSNDIPSSYESSINHQNWYNITYPISQEELSSTIKSLPLKSAPGPDKIHFKAWSWLHLNYPNILLSILNSFLSSKTIPNC